MKRMRIHVRCCLLSFSFWFGSLKHDNGVKGFSPPVSFDGGTKKFESSRLHGIKGFRAWFESQFPDAMIPLTHSRSRGGRHTDSEKFDHVLIDVNQLLHVALRRAKSEGHALTLLIKELDKYCEIAQPQKCLVLALDGPPSAAKLATQRRRRYGTIVRGKLRNERMQFIKKRNALLSDSYDHESADNQSSQKKRRSKYLRDIQTLCITPGTAFMDRAHDTLLYWAWQRMSNPFGPLAYVRIYISPSSVPGEGEVKLLDWLLYAGGVRHYLNPKQTNNNHPKYKKKRSSPSKIIQPGHSVAIMGGDSDLVLEALIISPSYITHNVFCILPHGNRKSYSVSLWETTRKLSNILKPYLKDQDIMRVRTDLVLLLIMNGNDYLPKLRGSSGFNKLFHTYLRLLKHWLQDQQESNKSTPFLVDPETLEYNIPFCIAFFQRLARAAPKLAQPSELIPYQNSVTPLSHLHTLIDSGFLPKPINWEITEDDASQKNNFTDSNPTEDTKQRNKVLDNKGENKTLRLTLGEEPIASIKSDTSKNSESLQYFNFEVPYSSGYTLKQVKQQLATIALEEILGKDYMNMHEYVIGNVLQNENSEGRPDELDINGENEDFISDNTLYYDDDDEDDDDEDDDEEDDDDEDDDDDDDNNDDEDETDQISNEEHDDMNFGSMSNIGYAWEIKNPVACKVDDYLGGLLWNLQTYQDGVCTNYGYNYGRRMSPTAEEIVDFFKEAQKKNQTSDRSSLLGDQSISPLNAGLSCLAALPSEVQYLVPEPYRNLSVNNSVEEIYASCMDPEANVFDIELFQCLCEDRLEKNELNKIELNKSGKILKLEKEELANNNRTSKGKQITTSDMYWVVFQKMSRPLSKPFAPPKAFSARISKLKPNNRIKVSRILATNESRALDKERKSLGHNQFKFGDASGMLKSKNGKKKKLHNLRYMTAYKNAKDEKNRRSKSNVFSLNKKVDEFDNVQKTDVRQMNQNQKQQQPIIDEMARMRKYNLIPPPTEATRNIEHQTAVQCLQQLKDSRLLSMLQWEWVAPSQTSYASFNPEAYETVKLITKAVSHNNENHTSNSNTEEIILEQDRNINEVSRKILKQHIASIAIQQLLGPKKPWTDMTVKEMREYLAQNLMK